MTEASHVRAWGKLIPLFLSNVHPPPGNCNSSIVVPVTFMTFFSAAMSSTMLSSSGATAKLCIFTNFSVTQSMDAPVSGRVLANLL